MNSSKRYEYQPLKKDTLVYSLQLGARSLFRHPFITLAIIASMALAVFPAIMHIAIIYMLCKDKWIDEEFKGNWRELKIFSSALMVGGVILIAAMITSAIFFSEPNIYKVVEEPSIIAQIGNQVVLVLGFIINTILLWAMNYWFFFNGSNEAYELHNGESSSEVVIKDMNMHTYSLVSYAVGLLIFKIFVGTSLIGTLFGAAALLFTCYFNSYVFLAHVYTPEPPKVKVTKLATSLS